MLIRHFYYHFKPYLPWGLRLVLRRLWFRRKRDQYSQVWPINQAARHAPKNWQGWPNGKKFALVLTHDIETDEGLARCRRLMAVEQRLGFRSSFNFVPEGSYAVPDDLRHELVDNGFEVGVHDLKHDGKLYRSRERFKQSAQRINHYLQNWNATGFRSAFMLHNLEWLHDLNVEYDASTFDTDPFEPQPDGVDTIFPFFVERPGHGGQESEDLSNSKFKIQNSKLRDQSFASSRLCCSTPQSELATPHSPLRTPHSVGPSSVLCPPFSGRSGYVELPYTLPQDFSLFILMQERSPEIWKRKLDWIAAHGGMVLLDVHPDYLTFDGERAQPWNYPVTLYQEFLEYVRVRYEGTFWHSVPKEVARQVTSNRLKTQRTTSTSHSITVGNGHLNGRKIWIDLDNTPHVPFFEPIIEQLKAHGYPLLVTARDAFQVCELANQKGISYLRIGRHHGRNPLLKVTGLFYRALQLAPTVLREKPTLAVSHGARSQIILSNLLKIPTVLLADYEFAQYPPLMRPNWEMVPDAIPDESLYCRKDRILKYPGIKEDVYAWKLKPDPSVLNQLGVSDTDLVVTVRPPATEAHYHNPESEDLFIHFMEWACRLPHIRLVLLPRNKKQGDFIRGHWPRWFKEGKTIIPPHAVDGMNLIWHSDLVVSGGGTMNREAAALGVPVYSIFRGPIGAVDQMLKKENRLVLVTCNADVEDKIRLVKRPKKALSAVTSHHALQQIVNSIIAVSERGARNGRPC